MLDITPIDLYWLYFGVAHWPLSLGLGVMCVLLAVFMRRRRRMRWGFALVALLLLIPLVLAVALFWAPRWSQTYSRQQVDAARSWQLPTATYVAGVELPAGSIVSLRQHRLTYCELPDGGYLHFDAHKGRLLNECVGASHYFDAERLPAAIEPLDSAPLL